MSDPVCTAWVIGLAISTGVFLLMFRRERRERLALQEELQRRIRVIERHDGATQAGVRERAALKRRIQKAIAALNGEHAE